jgi:hypothetical protein
MLCSYQAGSLPEAPGVLSGETCTVGSGESSIEHDNGVNSSKRPTWRASRARLRSCADGYASCICASCVHAVIESDSLLCICVCRRSAIHGVDLARLHLQSAGKLPQIVSMWIIPAPAVKRIHCSRIPKVFEILCGLMMRILLPIEQVSSRRPVLLPTRIAESPRVM